MRVRNLSFALAAGVLGVVLSAATSVVATSAQAGGGAAQGAGRGTAAPAARVQGNLVQLMRGILFPASNVIFAVQSVDPATIKPADDPSASPNPLTSTYGQWQAVENAGVSLAEAANLLIIPGRMCANGRPVPMQNADWQMWVQELRDAGMATVKAAQSKNQDAILDAAGVVSEACSHCHDKYREVKVRC